MYIQSKLYELVAKEKVYSQNVHLRGPLLLILRLRMIVLSQNFDLRHYLMLQAKIEYWIQHPCFKGYTWLVWATIERPKLY